MSKLYDSQVEMQYGIDNNHNWVHMSCRRAGKTYGAANVVKNQLLKPNSFVLVFENHGFRDFGIYPILIDLIPKSLIEYTKGTSRDIKLLNNSSVIIKKADSEKYKKSYIDYFKKPDLAVFEEMYDEKYELFLNDMILMNVKCLVTGTPLTKFIPDTTKQTLFYSLWLKTTNPLNTQWNGKKYSWEESEYWTSNPDHLKVVKEGLPEKLFKTEIEATFNDD